MQWDRSDRPTTILMIHQSHGSTRVNFKTWSKWSKAATPVTAKQLQATFSSHLNNEKYSVMGGRWLSQHCCVSFHSDWLLWEGQRETLPAGLHPGGHRCKWDWGVGRVYSPTQFSKSHILTQPLSPVTSYGPLSLLLRTTISSLWLPCGTSRQLRQVAWPGNAVEAVQRNCSICTFSLAAATPLPTALLQVCCCDVFMKTCQIFPTINPGVQQR